MKYLIIKNKTERERDRERERQRARERLIRWKGVQSGYVLVGWQFKSESSRVRFVFVIYYYIIQRLINCTIFYFSWQKSLLSYYLIIFSECFFLLPSHLVVYLIRLPETVNSFFFCFYFLFFVSNLRSAINVAI